MREWLYTIPERLTADMQPQFRDYQAFSGFVTISELVTLDGMMCPDVITELTTEDWSHNVHEDFRITLFRDADYLLSRQPLIRSQHQVIAAWENPRSTEAIPPGFEKCGYDVMDSHFGNSTLTNCGQIPEAFSPADVNQYGLIDDCDTAY